ncbi:hypothetical protein [Prosthecobacter sp.]|uniref:hypothetical protein n=1 Tax=Prosthecobacter sp. TaxID=1965333 RepID=UPI002486E131|nr:hypothetical protein [Prosthecobacter sp.]MDI1311629.1 hypothetical protein [Prosthecobacter sp.]
MESLVFRTLFARRFGKPEKDCDLVKDIVKRQRGDGAWSYILGGNMSDVLATEQALYVLQAPTHGARHRACPALAAPDSAR